MKNISAWLVLLIVLFIIGCATIVDLDVTPVANKTLTPKDYFERVYVYDIGFNIPQKEAEKLEKVGDIRIQNYGGKQVLLRTAMAECRKLGGNLIVIKEYREKTVGMSWTPYRPGILKVIAYFRVMNENDNALQQMILRGPTEKQLKESWITNKTIPYEGIYQAIHPDNNYKLKVGFQRQEDGRVYVLYLSGISGARSWEEGDVIGVFESTAIQGVFLGNWVNLDKYTTSAELVFNRSGSFIVSYVPWSQSNKIDVNYIRVFPKDDMQEEAARTSFTGTGFLLSPNGYIVTCHHVVQNAKKIHVVDNDNNKTRLQATVSVSDVNNDLCILKVSGLSVSNTLSIPYGFDNSLNRTGESVFCMGFPLLQVMGNEIKVTNGIISSVTGYKGDVSSYQVSAPAQPGNSGGPLFNSSGNVIGVVNAKISHAENVSYAVKISCLDNLISIVNDNIKPMKANQSASSLSSMVEKFKPFVYIVEVEN